MTLSCTIFSREAAALSSSIESGWIQCSGGTCPNSIWAALRTDSRLSKLCNYIEKPNKGREKREKNEPLEIICEWFVVQENIGIVISSVEPILDWSDSPNCTFQVRVPGQDKESGVCSGCVRGVHTCKEGWEVLSVTVVVVVAWG